MNCELYFFFHKLNAPVICNHVPPRGIAGTFIFSFYESLLKPPHYRDSQLTAYPLNLLWFTLRCHFVHVYQIPGISTTLQGKHKCNKNSAEVDIAPAFGEITTACNVGQAKKGHGACLKSGQLVYARFHTHSHRCCREMYFNSRLDIKFGQSQWSVN